jgi:hypothetical protein
MAKLYYVAPLAWVCPENPITIGDNKFQVEMPYDGELLGNVDNPSAYGCIQQAGAGAGTETQFMLRVVEATRDLLTSPFQFRVDDADVNGRAPLVGGVLSTRPRFSAGQHIALDCDGLPGGANSSHAVVTVMCGFWREVE